MTDEEAQRRLAAIRAEAARRTGWKPWMTAKVGWGGLGRDYVAIAEKHARQNERYRRRVAPGEER